MSIFYMPSASAFGQHLRPSDGALLYFFDAGTTNAKTTYSDAAETVANTHPVVADSSGLFGLIYLSGTYKAVLKDKNEVQLWEEDNLTHPGGAFLYTGTFDSSTNASNYPASGDKGFAYKVSTGFTLAAASGSHLLYTGDFIVANKDGATGIDADWDIIRGGVELIDGIIDIPRNAPAGLLTVTTGVPSAVIWNDTGGNVDYRIEGDTDTNLFFLDASQDRIGIGTGTPDGIFHIHTGTAGAITASLNDLTVESNTNGGATFLTPDANFSGLYFGSPSDSAGAKISWKYDDDLMFIRTSKVGAELAFGSDNETETYRIDGEKLIFGATAALQAGTNSNFQIQGTGDSDSTLSIMRFSAAIDPPEIQFMKSGSASIGSQGILTDGEGLGRIEFFGDDGTDYRSSGAYISASVDGTPGANDMPGRLVFATTADGSASPTEAMRIDSSQNVLIGASIRTGSASPSLELARATGAVMYLRRSDTTITNTNSLGTLNFTGDDPTASLRVGASINVQAAGTWDTADYPGQMIFNTTAVGGSSPTERMRITSAGLVGIGTDSPEGHLHVMTSDASVAPSADADQGIFENNAKSGISILASDAQNAAVYLGSSSSNLGASMTWKYSTSLMEIGTSKAGGQLILNTAAAAEAVRIDSAGNVGIGTDSPRGITDVGYSGASANTYIGTWSTTTTHQSSLLFTKSNSATIGTYLETADGESLGTIGWFGSDSSNTISSATARIDAEQDGAAGGTNIPGRLIFGTGTNAAAATERMRIDSSGNVGIGTDSPVGILHISSAAPAFYITDTTNNTDAAITSNNVGALLLYADVNDERADSYMGMFVDGAEKMRIDSTGNVGIGTASPDGTLHAMTASAGTITAQSFADDFVIENNTHAGLTILTPNTATGYVVFGDEDDSAVGWMQYDQSANEMKLATANAIAVTIDSSQNVGIGTASPLSLLHLGTATEELEIVDAGSAGATEQDWIQVEVGGVTGYIRVYAAV